MRTNEMRRVGYPSHIRESRFRFFGTEASFEQLATVSLWQDKQGVTDVSELIGFMAPSAFSRWFRQRFEVTPTQWRDASRHAAAG